MNNEALVALLDEAYDFIVSDYLDRMLETTVSALNLGWIKMFKNYGEWEETDFKKFATELYRAWLSGGKEALAATIEKREQKEGENE